MKKVAMDHPTSVDVLLGTREPEALFSVAKIRALRLPSHYDRPSVSDFFAHQVARDPTDLRRHVQRINFFLTNNNGPAAYGAIVDLFITLGRKGTALRHRMLLIAFPVLSQEQRNALEGCLENGLSPLDQVPLSSESILGKGIRGTTRLVDRAATPAQSSRDLLEEARSRLEYGQVDEARRVLEKAVLLDPSREDLHLGLLEIYVRSKEYAHFNLMLRSLREASIPVPSAWQRLAADLGLA